MATFAHRAGGSTRTVLALVYFLMISLVSGGALVAYRAAITPPSRTITCDRAAGRCTATGLVHADDTVTFTFDRIDELNVRREGDDAWLARERDHWSVETSDPSQAAALDAAVAALQAFTAGEGDSVTVTIPNGPPRGIVIGIVVMLAGLLQLVFIRLITTGARVDVGERVQVVASKGIGPAVRRDVAKAAIRTVKQWKERRGRFFYVNVTLEVDGEEPVPVVREYWSSASEAATVELAQKLRDAIGLPPAP